MLGLCKRWRGLLYSAGQLALGVWFFFDVCSLWLAEQESEDWSEITFIVGAISDSICSMTISSAVPDKSPGSTSGRVSAVWGYLGFHGCERGWLCSDLG